MNDPDTRQDDPASSRAAAIGSDELARLRAVLLAASPPRRQSVDGLDQQSAEFETLFRSSPVGLAFAQDMHCAVVIRNAAMNLIIPSALDWSTWRVADGSAPVVLREGQVVSMDQQPLRRAALHGERATQHEMEIQLPGCEPLFALVSAEPLLDVHGKPRGAIAAVVDITAQKRAGLKLALMIEREQAARLLAEAANRAKDELLAMLGHELRNPLNAIATSVEVLNRSEPGSREAVSARNIIGRQTRKLAYLMDDLVEVGRVMSDEIQLQRQPLDLAALVQRSVRSAEAHAAAKGQTLHTDMTPVWVHGDAQRLSQVMERLLDNAVKYTPSGGSIEVRLRKAVDAKGQHAVLNVCDTGIGIEPELIDRVFDPFVQGPRNLDRQGGGLGIGLTLVRRLVEKHDGSVEAKNLGVGAVRPVGGAAGAQRGRGSEFELRLPAIDGPRDGSSASARGARQLSVGVIDDNPDALFGLCAVLGLDGHTVKTAVDGPLGLQMLLGEAPDVAIVDIGLPGFDGYEVARRARAEGFGGRLIALSGYGQEHDMQRSLAAGFETHLVKPVDPAQLSRLLSA